MKRISVVGSSGSGKTTFASRLARALSLPHIELDAIYHRSGWTPLPRHEFRAEIERQVGEAGWVIDGNYGTEVLDLVWVNADTVVWLQIPRHLVMRRIIGRSLRRAFKREELWNGNRERFRNLLSLDPERSVILWAYTRYDKYREQYEQAMEDPTWSRLRFIRLTSQGEVRDFLDSCR
ncbi:MAG TPA: adenylate kinase [Actinomycetota bacterium]|nr:adenylate kinase [Actinomycetota bacterium]